MAIDLSGLDLDMDPQEGGPEVPSGKPLELAIDDVMEDPNQPRKEFPAEQMAEMVASIRERGVKTPISVKPHPTLPGKYLINYGARRYRASKEAGKTTIPAFVDDAHDDYDQVIENLQRENLTALELATFIHKKIAEGEKPSAIAKKLGKKPSMVSEHMALVDAPAIIMDLYESGRGTSVRALYDLRSLYEKHPEAVSDFLAGHTGDITVRAVASLAAELKGGPRKPAAGNEPPATNATNNAGKAAGGGDGESASFRTYEKSNAATDGEGGEKEASPATAKDANRQTDGGAGTGKTPAPAAGGDGAVEKILSHNPANESALGKPATKGDPSRLKKPVMIVEYDGRAAMVMIFTRPSTPGLLWIKYEDNGEEIEVACGDVRINNLQDATA